MPCRNCGSDRIAYLQAHSKDLSIFQYDKLNIDNDGYFPTIPGVCSGDDADFNFCLECGMIQSDTFPITDEIVKEACRGWEDDDEEDDGTDNPYSTLPTLTITNQHGIITAEGLTGFWQLEFVKEVEKISSFEQWLITIDPETQKHYLVVYHSTDDADFFVNSGEITGDEEVAFKYVEWADFKAYEAKRGHNE